MSAKPTEEEVRNMATNVRDCAWPADVDEYMVLIEPMLRDLAERIKADEGVVPFGWVNAIGELSATRRNSDDTPVFTHPPAQAAQATTCAGCGKHKNTPLRIDAMGGYVCLTCIDEKLSSLLDEFSYPDAAEPVAQGEADLCDCDVDKYNKLPHHADCAALAAQPRAVPDGFTDTVKECVRDLRKHAKQVYDLPKLAYDLRRLANRIERKLAATPSPGESA